MSTAPTPGIVPEFTLADRLRKARDVAGLEQSELADAMGVSRRTVTNSEHGHVKVRPITIKAWALATGVSVEWLETGRVAPTGGGDGGVSVTSRYPATRRHLTAIHHHAAA